MENSPYDSTRWTGDNVTDSTAKPRASRLPEASRPRGPYDRAYWLLLASVIVPILAIFLILSLGRLVAVPPSLSYPAYAWIVFVLTATVLRKTGHSARSTRVARFGSAIISLSGVVMAMATIYARATAVDAQAERAAVTWNGGGNVPKVNLRMADGVEVRTEGTRGWHSLPPGTCLVVRRSSSELGFVWIDIVDRVRVGNAGDNVVLDDPDACFTKSRPVTVLGRSSSGIALLFVMIVGVGLLYMAAVRLGSRSASR